MLTSSNPPTPDPPDTGPERFLRVDHLNSDLRGRSVRGGAITIVNQALKFAVALGSTAILARILTPADFGLIGMAIAVLTACAQGETTPASSPESVAQSCQDAGFEPNTAEFRDCQETLGNAALIRSRVRELRGSRR